MACPAVGSGVTPGFLALAAGVLLGCSVERRGMLSGEAEDAGIREG